MNIVENIKSIGKTIQQLDNIELYQKILDVQAQALEIMEQDSKLRDENKDLREKLEIKGSLKYRNNAYWIENDGPYCTRCWDAEKKPIRLHPDGNPAYFHCPNCKAESVLVKPELDFRPQVIEPDIDPYI